MNPFAPKPDRSRTRIAWLLAAFLSLFVLAACGTAGDDDTDDPTTGALTVTVAGLPADADADVTVSDGDDVLEALTGTATLPDLAPGEYAVTAEDVAADDATYVADVSDATPTVVAGETTTVIVDYEEVEEAFDPGSADTTFGDEGVASYDFAGTDATVRDLEIHDDGGMTLVGSKNDGELVIARVDADGGLDAGFGTGTDDEAGLTIEALGGTIEAVDMRVDDDWITVAAVSEVAVDDHDVHLLRFDRADGTTDAGFTSTADLPFAGDASEVRFLDDGRVLVAGSAENPDALDDDADLVITRFAADGSLDTTFGESADNVTYVDQGPDDEALGLEVLADGDILLYGRTDEGVEADFTVVRLDEDGELLGDDDGETPFGPGDAYLTVDVAGDADVPYAATLHDGDVIMGGSAYDADSGDLDFGLIRFAEDGTLDEDFGPEGTDGLVADDFGGDDVLTELVSDGDGLIAAGTSEVDGDVRAVLARYTAGGELDASFGDDGSVVMDLDGATEGDVHVLALDDDRIVLAGDYGGQGRIAVFHR